MESRHCAAEDFIGIEILHNTNLAACGSARSNSKLCCSAANQGDKNQQMKWNKINVGFPQHMNKTHVQKKIRHKSMLQDTSSGPIKMDLCITNSFKIVLQLWLSLIVLYIRCHVFNHSNKEKRILETNHF